MVARIGSGLGDWILATIFWISHGHDTPAPRVIIAARVKMTAGIIPFSTVTVFESTILQTTFVTVHASTLTGLPTTSGLRSSNSHDLSSASAIRSSALAGTHTAFPSVLVSPSTSSSVIPAVMASPSTAPQSTAIPIAGKDGEQKSHKIAIVGGLTGTIAGLIFIGVILCLLLRRRRKKAEHPGGMDWAAREDTPTPHVVEKSFFAAGVHSRPGTAVTRDDRIIHINTRHWSRPFALGAGEGYRESIPAGQLRCTNPDPSRPNTSQTIPKTPPTLFNRKRSLSRTTEMSQRHSLAQEVPPVPPVPPVLPLPTIKVVDPILSRELISRYSGTPSFKSYPSISTVQVAQQPSDDPFRTPSTGQSIESEQTERSSAPRPTTAASKTWAHILNPLRSRSPSCLELRARASSECSVDTVSSSARFSRRSDPFDLDRQSRNWNAGSEVRSKSHFTRRSQILYEGT
ncbi:uncharacterized protein RCC_00153 [Ramularia collo-cygni]|uniref:Uncharacterized protein n=1 Tax=Ramularia collo-cygni TaxID=112498 RepID=A0A2D3UYC6_9PEZI|nr:uncharacterized protein RCC_00153 [Ramularia collo-cygni]CZT14179.1 uncharacterized protein RCC_00153 [Ramularia collo-cygni]